MTAQPAADPHSDGPSAGCSRPQSKSVVLLDRDGTVNVERHYLSEPEDVELLPGAAGGIRRLKGLGFKVVMVTNQSAIGRGYFGWETLEGVHRRLHELLESEGAVVDGILVCPHASDDGCECRKPRPGLACEAARRFDVDLKSGFVIGDKPCDIGLGKAIGATTILVRTGHGAETEGCLDQPPDYVADDLAEAILIVEGCLGR